MSALPEWTLETLKDAKVTLLDCDHKTPKAQDCGRPYVGIPQLKDGRISLEGARLISEDDFHLWRRKAKPSPHDIILSRRCNPGVTAYVPEGLEIALGQNLVLLRASGEKMFPPFLRWVVQGPIWWGQVRTFLNTGAVFESLKCADIPKFEIKLPPLSEQKAIADMLSSFDEKIELLREQNKTLETLAQTIFKEWFVDYNYPDATGEMVDSELGKIPKGWWAGKLGDVTSIKGGGTPSTKNETFWNGDIHWTSPKDLSNAESVFLLDTEKKLTQEGLKKVSSGLLPKRTLLLSSRAPIGYIAISNVDIAINQGYIALLDDAYFSNYYMLFWLKTHMRAVTNAANGSTFLEISKSAFRNIDCVIPSKGELKDFDEIVEPTLDKVLENMKQIQTLSKSRDTLLPKLMSGQVRIQCFSPSITSKENKLCYQ